MVISGSGSASGSGSSALGVDDRDLCLFEREVEVVELRGLQLELVERERELVRVDLAGAIAALEQPLALVAREDLLDRRSSGSALRFFSGQTAPLPRRPSHGSYRCGGRQKQRSRARRADRLEVASGLARQRRARLRSRSEPELALGALRSRPVQRSRTPRWKRTVGSFGYVPESGPRRPNARSGRVLVELPDGTGHLRLDVVRIAPRGPVEDPRGRDRPPDALEADAVEELLAEAACGSPRARSASSWRAGGRLVIAGDALNDGMNAGRPRGSSGCRRFPATTAYGVSGSASSTARHASTGSPSFAHEPREPEVKLHDGDARGRAWRAARAGRASPSGQCASAAPTFASSESCLANSAAAAAVSPRA